MTKPKRVLVAMSGGVDSTVAALMLLEKGYEVIGVTYETWTEQAAMKKPLITYPHISQAANIADKLNIHHIILDIKKRFFDSIVKDFIQQYMSGYTPNPCVLCNFKVKWAELLKVADENGCDFVATGHYATINSNEGRCFISKAKDKQKDQSYFLWMLSQEQLGRTLFPLSGYTKEQVKEIAHNNGFMKLASQKESQEVCFITDDDYRKFLREQVPDIEDKIGMGRFVDSQGKILGEHQGYPFYTVGQRKGLNVAVGKPVYVTHIDPESNTITLGDKSEVYSDEMWVRDFKPMKYKTLKQASKIKTKIRYRNREEDSIVEEDDGRLHVKFCKPVLAVTPGQSAVFYEGDDVLGGGFIV